MKYSINSRDFGAVKFSTSSNSRTAYLSVVIPGDAYTTPGRQCCTGGRLLGSTVIVDATSEATFQRECRQWWKSYLSRCDQFDREKAREITRSQIA